jgi:GDP-fucose transporter C1
MSTAISDEIFKRNVRSAAAVSFYMTVSIGLVLLNRLVLTDKNEKSGALFLSWLQFVVAYILILIITFFFPNVPLLNLFPPLNYKWDVFLKVLPVSVAYLFMIGFNNKCLEYVSVSGYHIVRSLTIVFNIILTYFILGDRTSWRAVLACIGIIVGFVLGVEGEIDLSIRGAIYGVCSSMCVAMYAIIVKKVMMLLDNNEYLLIEYNTPIAIVVLAPFVWYSGEFDIIGNQRSLHFWGMQILAGVVGFVINIAIFLNIKYTTPLTHNLSGTVKACVQMMLAFVIFPETETMTWLKFIGVVMVIGFAAFYAWVRKQEGDKRTMAELDAKQRAMAEEGEHLLGSVGFDNVESRNGGQA